MKSSKLVPEANSELGIESSAPTHHSPLTTHHSPLPTPSPSPSLQVVCASCAAERGEQPADGNVSHTICQRHLEAEMRALDKWCPEVAA